MEVPTDGELLRAARNEAGLTSRQAGEAIGVSHVTILGWERGRSRPDWMQLSAMALAYGVHIDELVSIRAELSDLPDEWPAGLREFVNSEEAVKLRLCPREVISLARAHWVEPPSRDRSVFDWAVFLVNLRTARNENPATGERPGRRPVARPGPVMHDVENCQAR